MAASGKRRTKRISNFLRSSAKSAVAILRKRYWRSRIAWDVVLRRVIRRLPGSSILLIGLLTLILDGMILRQRVALIALPSEFFDVLLTAIGAMLGAILAITLSFRLFAVQVAAERDIPSLLPLSVRDRLNDTVTGVLAVLVMSLFAFTAVNRIHPSYRAASLVIAASGVGFALILLRLQFLHNVSLANPLEQIRRLEQAGLRCLRRMRRFADGIAGAGLMSLAPEDAGRLSTVEALRSLRTGVYLRYPGFLGETALRRYVSLIDSISGRAARRQDYDVVQRGLGASVSLISEYFALRHDTILAFPTGAFTVSTVADEFMKDFLERQFAIGAQAVRDRDVVVCRNVVGSMRSVAVAVTGLELAGVADDNPPIGLVRIYVRSIAREALRADLVDVGLEAIEAFRQIGIACASRGLRLQVDGAAEELAELGLRGFTIAENPLTNAVLGVMAELLFAEGVTDYSQAADASQLLRHVGRLTDIANSTIPATAPLSMTFAVGEFWDLSHRTAIGHVHTRLGQGTLIGEDARTIERSQRRFLEFDESLYRFFNRFGRPPITAESLLFLYLGQQIWQVVNVLLRLVGEGRWEAKREVLLSHITWHISALWRWYDDLTAVTMRYPLDFAHIIVGSGFKLCESNAVPCAVSLMSTAKTLGTLCATRGVAGTKGYAVDIAADLALLGAFALERGFADLLEVVDSTVREILASYRGASESDAASVERRFRNRVAALMDGDIALMNEAVRASSRHVGREEIDRYVDRVLPFEPSDERS